MAKPSFEKLYSEREWEPIRDCPGRYALRGVDRRMNVESMVGTTVQVSEHQSIAAKDTVLVALLEGGGGIISYRRSDGSFLHTLNDEEGLERKLKQLGIDAEVDRER